MSNFRGELRAKGVFRRVERGYLNRLVRGRQQSEVKSKFMELGQGDSKGSMLVVENEGKGGGKQIGMKEGVALSGWQE